MFQQALEKAESGDQVGVLLRGVKRDDLTRGMVISKPGSVNMSNHARAQVCSTNIGITHTLVSYCMNT